jgi:hypothetical protein
VPHAQNAGGALQYVNELLVRSDEPFVRFFPGHFSSIDPSRHGLPLTLSRHGLPLTLSPHGLSSTLDGSDSMLLDGHQKDKVESAGQPPANECNLTGLWFDLSSNGPHPTPFKIQRIQRIQQSADPHTITNDAFIVELPNEWGCPVYINRTQVAAVPTVPPVPRLVGHPECGDAAAAVPAVPAHTQMRFLWPAHGKSGVTVQNLSVSTDCNFMCFPPKWSAEGQGPFARTKGPHAPPPGTCPGQPDESPPQAARPWLNSTFSNLRVKGAQGSEACPLSKGRGLCTFLVNGSISAVGIVGVLSVQSESGGNFTFLSPWAASAALTVTCSAGPGCSSGEKVPVRSWEPQGLFHLEPHEQVLAFETQPGTTYAVAAS